MKSIHGRNGNMLGQQIFYRHNRIQIKSLTSILLNLDTKICESKILSGIWKEYTFHEQKICTQSGGHRGLHPETMPNNHIHEHFIEIKVFNLKSNFDQATQKFFKNAILYDKIKCRSGWHYCLSSHVLGL